MGDARGALRRDIGVVGAGFIALNGIVGAGIFAMPQTLVEGVGAFSPYFVVLIGVLMIAVAAVMAELAGYFDEAGGPVLYASAAFGPLWAFQVGWIFYLARVTAFAANTNVLLTYVAAYAPVDHGVLRAGAIVLVTAALVGNNIAGVKGAVRTLNVVTVLKLAPLLLFTVWGLAAFAGSIPAPRWPSAAPSLNDTSLVLIYAYVGFEAMPVLAGETRDAKRAIPRALIMTIIAMVGLYFAIQLAYVAVMHGRAPDGAPLAAAAAMLAGPGGAAAITLAAIFSIGGNLMGSMLAAPRVTFAMAQDGSLPQWFGQVDRRFATPVNSIVAAGVLGGILAASGAFVWLAVMSSLARLFTYLISIAALPKLRAQAPALGRGPAESVWRLAAPVLAAGLCVWAMTQAKADAWAFIAAFTALGVLLYALSRWRRRQASPI